MILPPKAVSGKLLTLKQKKYLADQCWSRCLSVYQNKMSQNSLINPEESRLDLEPEAHIAMYIY